MAGRDEDAGDDAPGDDAPDRRRGRRTPEAEAAVVAPGRIADMAQARAALEALETYFRTREPSSPSLILVRQARQLVGRPLIEAMEILVPEMSARARIDFGRESGFLLGMDRMRALSEIDGGRRRAERHGGAEATAEWPADFAVSSRKEAGALMSALESYYASFEPSSPIPVLLSRARGYLNQSFTAILAELPAARGLSGAPGSGYPAAPGPADQRGEARRQRAQHLAQGRLELGHVARGAQPTPAGHRDAEIDRPGHRLGPAGGGKLGHGARHVKGRGHQHPGAVGIRRHARQRQPRVLGRVARAVLDDEPGARHAQIGEDAGADLRLAGASPPSRVVPCPPVTSTGTPAKRRASVAAAITRSPASLSSGRPWRALTASRSAPPSRMIPPIRSSGGSGG